MSRDAVPPRGSRGLSRARPRGASLAGLLLLVAATSTLMGIITGEAVYGRDGGAYSTHLNEISDLGVPPASGDRSAVPIFNGAIVLSGASIVAAAYVLGGAIEGRVLRVALALHGAGNIGVGFFPSDQRALHLGFAVLTFAAGGIAALLASRVQAGLARYASAAFGVVVLTALALAGLGSRTSIYDALGPGGMERWIAYPTVLWLAAFGGYLMGHRSEQ